MWEIDNRREARNQAIVELAKQGVRPRDIAVRHGVSGGTIFNVVRDARRDGEAIPRFNTHGEPRGTVAPGCITVAVCVPIDVIDDLDGPARLRGVAPAELARRIIETVVEADLINAVLDDGVSGETHIGTCCRPNREQR